MNILIQIVFTLICFSAIAYLIYREKVFIFPFGMAIANPDFGNSLIAVILEADNTFPVTLTQWTGSTGNIHYLKNLAQGTTEDSVTTDKKEFRTNDNAIYGIKPTYTGITKSNFFGRAELDVTFLSTAVKNALEAGKRILIICNLGYENAKWMETFKIGLFTPMRIGKDNDEQASMLEFVSTPLSSAFTLSGANVTAIEAVSATNYVVRAAGPVVIPAAPYPEIVVYT